MPFKHVEDGETVSYVLKQYNKDHWLFNSIQFSLFEKDPR